MPRDARRVLHRVAVLAIVAAVLLPLVPLAIWSVGQRWFFPDVLPSEWSLRAWAYVASPRTQVVPALWDSTVIALGVTALSLLVGLPAGRALGLHRFRGKTLVEFLLLAPILVPTIAVAMGIHIAFIRYGLADSHLGVALVHLVPVTPYVVLVLASVFANYPIEYEEQARTLGASPWQTFWHVTRPAIWPGIVVGGLFAFIISWSQYLLTLLIGGGQIVTLPLLLFTFANSGDNPITAALSVVFIGPALLVLLLTARYLTGQDAALGSFGQM